MTIAASATIHPRSAIAATVANRAERVAAAGPIAAGPGTPGAIVTHAGNYIVPAAIDGFATCPTCRHEMPETKFPTRPAGPDGIVTRAAVCRSCRDYATAGRKIGRPAHVPPVHHAQSAAPMVWAPGTAPVPPVVTATAPVAPMSADDRMSARWTVAGDMTHVVESAAATIAAFGPFDPDDAAAVAVAMSAAPVVA